MEMGGPPPAINLLWFEGLAPHPSATKAKRVGHAWGSCVSYFQPRSLQNVQIYNQPAFARADSKSGYGEVRTPVPVQVSVHQAAIAIPA